MADFEALEVVAGVSGLSRTAKRLINRFHEAYKHYPHIKHALDNCSDELTRLIDIIYLIEDEDVLQTAGVVTALTKLQAVEVALLRHLKTLQQGELSRGNPKKIEDITKDLDRAKSDVCLQIQTAPVGLTFTTNDTVIADAKVINRIDSLLLRFIGKGQGLKIASLLSEWDLQDGGLVSLSKAEVVSLSEEVAGATDSKAATGSGLDDQTIDVEILNNTVADSAIQILGQVGENKGMNRRVRIHSNYVERRAVQIGAPVDFETLKYLLDRQRSDAATVPHRSEADATHAGEGIQRENEAAMFLADDKLRPLLRKNSGSAFLSRLPPAIAVATSETAPAGLGLAPLKQPSEEYKRILSVIGDMVGARDEGCILPSESVPIEDSTFKIIPALSGVALKGRIADLKRIATYWGILTASTAAFHGQELDWYAREMKPIDGSEYTQFTPNNLDSWIIPKSRFDDSFRRGSEESQPVDLGKNKIEFQAFRHQPFKLIDGASCWTKILNLRSIFTLSEGLQEVVDITSGTLETARTLQPGAMLIQTNHLSKIFPGASIEMTGENGEEKIFIETRRGTLVLDPPETYIDGPHNGRLARGHALSWRKEEIKEIKGHEEKDEKEEDEEDLEEEVAMINFLQGGIAEPKRELLEDWLGSTKPLPDSILLGMETAQQPVQNQAIVRPELTCFDHKYCGLPGAPAIEKPKSWGIQGNVSGGQFLSISLGGNYTKEIFDAWTQLGRFGDDVDELSQQAVILVNWFKKSAVVTTGLHVALSFEKKLFDEATAVELNELVKRGDSTEMTEWAKRFLERPQTEAAEKLNKALIWYSTSFRTLSTYIAQPDSPGTYYGADAASLQAKHSIHMVRRTPRRTLRTSMTDLLTRSPASFTWKPANSYEGLVIFVDPSYHIINRGDGNDIFIAAAIPSAMRRLERQPYYVNGKEEVRFKWSERSTVMSNQDPESHFYKLESDEVIYETHKQIPSWAEQRCARVLLLI